MRELNETDKQLNHQRQLITALLQKTILEDEKLRNLVSKEEGLIGRLNALANSDKQCKWVNSAQIAFGTGGLYATQNIKTELRVNAHAYAKRNMM